ncbi:hypothetical protein EMIHUDRAFT_206328 [Emiliania huxleyi CCMP1516]|uniref:SET domain-containing protein n=2 Tax=Emiliania huxleyi TaxID=2903 RepID=A0A0D3JNT9_EMIH1|nr:hypothetical protein EMIHUDRAFT_206328 [Emiliania huxleyi CCMP1516]EOD25174.1 hypothetical protein EMIHUDRAFT_206328 [Emiliania huxleyi CCMP1516]|eukprot:XP_005777603.1 hypothetical protein EMIHUDRAFT_206328 [Emiliania huxleyi CCMP1516]
MARRASRSRLPQTTVQGTFVVRTDERGLGLVAAAPVEAGGCFARDTPELLRELLSRPRWAGLLRGPLALHHCAEHLEQADAEAEVSAAPRPQWAEALGVTADGLARLSAALRSNVVWLPAAADAGGCGSGCYELRARRRIEGGEELSFSYLGLPATGKRRPTRAERREQLHERWGFWCECALCGSEGGDAVRVQASPASRKRVR